MKTIGIDARFFGEAGPGRYAKAILEHLEKIECDYTFIIFLKKKGFDAYKPKSSKFVKVLADFKWYSFEEQILFLLLLLKYRLDLFYVPHFNIPIFYPFKIVTAIPDVIMHTFSTEKATTLPLFYFRFKKFVYKFVFAYTVFRSYKVIVPSNTVLDDFLSLFRWTTKSKYVLAKEGVDPDFLKEVDSTLFRSLVAEFDISKPYLLYVGSAYEHKNLPRLVEAFEVLKKSYNFTGQLVIIGKSDNFSKNLKKIIEEKKLSKLILMPGLKRFISDPEIISLRKEALLYVFPSLKEGFSLTPMEAQAVKLPCAISDTKEHREIYGDSVIFFDPYNPQDMAQKINMLLTDDSLKVKLTNLGLENVSKYSWENTAKKTMNTFVEALNS